MNKDFLARHILPHSDSFFRLAKFSLNDEELAKDIVQDLYVKLLELDLQVENVKNISAYAHRILRNLCLDYVRTQQEFTKIPEQIEDRQTTPFEKLEQQNTHKLIRKIINTLPEQQKTAVVLRDIEGYEYSEIAEIMETTTNTVMANLSRARKQIRNRLNIETLSAMSSKK